MEYLGVSAQNPGQLAVQEMLNNRKSYGFLTGPAGTGKTLITAAAGLHQVINRPKEDFKRVIYTRLQVQTGLNVGYIPGDLEGGKTESFIQPFKDAFKKMDSPFTWDQLTKGKSQKVEFIPIQLFRGRTFDNAFIILDEVQNMDTDTFVTCMTRLGVGSKMLLLGNFAQIDDADGSGKIFQPAHNGLYQILKALYGDKNKGHLMFDHHHLTSVERSDGAAYIENLMRNQQVDKLFIDMERRGIPEDLIKKAAV